MKTDRAGTDPPAFKAKVALAAIKGERTLAGLAEQFTSIPIRSRHGRLSSKAARVFHRPWNSTIVAALT